MSLSLSIVASQHCACAHSSYGGRSTAHSTASQSVGFLYKHHTQAKQACARDWGFPRYHIRPVALVLTEKPSRAPQAHRKTQAKVSRLFTNQSASRRPSTKSQDPRGLGLVGLYTYIYTLPDPRCTPISPDWVVLMPDQCREAKSQLRGADLTYQQDQDARFAP